MIFILFFEFKFCPEFLFQFVTLVQSKKKRTSSFVKSLFFFIVGVTSYYSYR